jgi:hypothetical protein
MVSMCAVAAVQMVLRDYSAETIVEAMAEALEQRANRKIKEASKLTEADERAALDEEATIDRRHAKACKQFAIRLNELEYQR